MIKNEIKLFEDEEEIKLTKRQKFKGIVEEGFFYILVLVVTTVFFFVLKPYYKNSAMSLLEGALSQSILVVLLGFICVIGFSYAVYGKLDRKYAIYLIFLAGVFIRIFYMLYTPITVRQHDTYNSGRTGHEAYAWTIFTTGKLPETNKYQFYHPPLNALVQSSFMHFMDWLTDGLTKMFNLGDYFPSKFLLTYSSAKLPTGSEERYFLYSTTQILAVTYSIITLVYLLKLVKLFGFKGKTSVILAASVALFPRLYQFAGMVNNDALSFMFSILALYCALKWQKQGRKFLNILFCALFCGLGMMTKLATATVCLPIAGVFIYEFILEIIDFVKTCKKREKINFKKTLSLPIQYICFLAICAPIGLWFQFYAFQKFGQPFGFVFGADGSTGVLSPLLRTDHHSLFERLVVAFDLNEYFGSLFCIPFSSENSQGALVSYNTYNLFNYLVRSAIFGEFTLKHGEGFAALSLVSAFVFCGLLAIGLVYIAVKFIGCKVDKKQFLNGEKVISFSDLIFLTLLVLSQLVPEISFYIKMPYACTQDFRYVMSLIPAVALITAYVKKVLVLDGNKIALQVSRAISVCTVVFIISSTILYCVCV